VEQLEDSLGALGKADFSEDELVEIDRYATDSGINLWQQSSSE
jgi:L-glyceraldehyde 3-phosphate reductase